MAHGDLLIVLRCKMPTRPLLDLSAVGRHTESSGTLCSVTDQTLTQWCRANRLSPMGPLPRSSTVTRKSEYDVFMS
jgi:hypothetical protein